MKMPCGDYACDLAKVNHLEISFKNKCSITKLFVDISGYKTVDMHMTRPCIIVYDFFLSQC